MSSEKSGDSLRGPAAPAAARRRRPAPAGALAHRPGPRLRGADAPRGGGHAAAGGLRGPRVPPAAAALHRLRAGLPCGRALCRRDPGGRGSSLHAARAAAGPGAGPAGAQAPAARLHAHRSADHHLLLLAHGHHRYFQGGAGAHGPGARRHGVGRDRLPRGAELLLHLPGGGHRGHGALHHPHRGHHHRRAAPRELLGPVRTPPARRRPAPLHLSAACAPAADPRGALHTRLRGCGTGMRPKLRLRGSPRGAGTLRIQFLRNRAEAHTPKDAASLGPSQTPGPRRPRLPSPLKAAPPGKLREGPWRSREPGPASPASSIGSAPALKNPASRSAGSAFFSSSRGASGRRLGLGHRASPPDRQTPPVLAA